EPIPDADLYAPLVLLNGKSIGTEADGKTPGRAVTGVMYEGFNTLTRRYRAQFTTGAGKYRESFFLPTLLDETATVTLELTTVYGTSVCSVSPTASQTVDIGDGTSRTVSVTPAEGRVDITPPFPVSTVSDNLTITATAKSATTDSTRGATIAAWFGGTQNRLGGTRLFLAGFSNEKAKVMWSDVNNPLYFPENNYMFVGDLSQRVTALEKQEDMLVIFKERELYYTTYVQGSIDEDTVASGLNVDVTVSQAYFPLTQLSPYIGCDCPKTLAVCRNRLVWLCRDGRVYTLIVGSQYSERNVREIGMKIREHITANTTEAERAVASAMDCDGQYTVMIGAWAYSFDYSASGFAYLTSYYSNDSLMKNLAWFVHRFESFVGSTVSLVSDGAYRAIAIQTQDLISEDGAKRVTMVRTVYRFEDHDSDSYATWRISENSDVHYAVGGIITDRPIAVTLTTKAYDFGDMATFKRIAAMFLSASAPNLYVRFIVDGVEDNEQKRVIADGYGARLVMPCVKRCRTLAIRFDSDEPVELRG
ncbi:MAG: hypothetical protein IKV35_05960, partial [Clostridia bacterium]|nr:hypothetical protein [Clostridia bacterium]